MSSTMPAIVAVLPDTPTATHMQCMEVWGGNQVVDSGVVMAGLDAWVYSRPYGEAAGGGDVHYVSSCATGRITRLLVADVSGHGAAVCDVAGQLRGLMRRYINHIDQTRFVRSMNEKFGGFAKAGCFATSLVMTFFGPNNQLSLCNAGHPPPLLYRAARRQWEYLEQKDSGREDAANVPLGILDEGDYEQFDVKLKVGDLVLCYTDSLVEAKGANGDLLGQSGLMEVVRGLGPIGDPAALIPTLLAAIATLHAGNLTEDDVTVLLFRPNGLAPTVPLRDRLLAPLRIARAVIQAVRTGEAVPMPDLKLANIGGAMFGPLNRLWRGTRR